MVLVLDFGAIGDRKANLAKAADDLLGHLRQRMQLAQRPATTWQSEIYRFFGRRHLEFEFSAALGQRGFQFGLGGVDSFAGRGLLLFGQCAQLFHQGGQFAV